MKTNSTKTGGYIDIREPQDLYFDSVKKIIIPETKENSPNLKNSERFSLIGSIPPMYPEWLGDSSFLSTHRLRFAYVGGAMARGIASSEMVTALAENGMLGFFGSAGLTVERVQQEISALKERLDSQGVSWGMNLIHTPDDPELEIRLAELYIQNNVRRIEASAFMALSPAIVYYAFKGLKKGEDGRIIRHNYVFAKISRPEVARHFLAPVPLTILQQLVNTGKLTNEEAQLGANLPLAEDITVEADSGGHTDRRPLGPLFSTILSLRNKLCSKYNYSVLPRLGAAGGLGTPHAIASAFALGAAYVCIGSVHQSCIEAGICYAAKKMLALADIADVGLTVSADMFEQGIKVQVLKRGTMMPQRANFLYQLFVKYNDIESIPEQDVLRLEKEIFRKPVGQVWDETKVFFKQVGPWQLEKAKTNPKHKMALIFRWYIGKSSQWPITGGQDRQTDYQLWCGPAMGAFNDWVKGTFLETLENRTIKQVSLNLMEGAAVIARAQQIRMCGAQVNGKIFDYQPERLTIKKNMA